MKTINRWSELPKFDSPEQEAAYWMENQIEPRLMNMALLKGANDGSATLTVRCDPRMLARIKRIAHSRYLSHESMVKQWLAERLEQEKS